MQCAANFEIRAECSIVVNDRVLEWTHPKGLYRVRLKNVPRNTFDNPFLLSLQLYFETPSLDEAKELVNELVADCLNFLAFSTGGGFRVQRIRQIVDATPKCGMRDVLMWGDTIQYEDPQPCIDDQTAKSIGRLLQFDCPPAIRRALRWYRLAVNDTQPDDQFMAFWFALEIIAEHQKTPQKVPDRCPHCRSPLFCETCKTHPEHRPYAKQAIVSLLRAVDPQCDDSTIELLDKSRNSLMHGSTLREIEESLPDPHEQVVDVLGRLVWRALLHQFPREMFDGKMVIGYPTTYVHYVANAIAHIQTIVPQSADGNLDMSFTGMTAKMESDGPPQSALPSVIHMTADQHERLMRLGYGAGDQKDMCRRVANKYEKQGESVATLVLATDLTVIRSALERGEEGDWQSLFRELLPEFVLSRGLVQ